MIQVLILTHGELGNELLRTAQLIVGKQEHAAVLTLTPQDSLATMREKTGAYLDAAKGGDGVLILTDMLGGTPCNASLPFSTTHRVEIVTGVNLYMLIAAFINRGQLALPELAAKVIADGQKNIANAKDIFLKKLK